MIKLTVGTRGEIVIPKKIRESLGIVRGRSVMLSIKDHAVEVRPAEIDAIATMEARAKRLHVDVSKIRMGNDLYREVF